MSVDRGQELERKSSNVPAIWVRLGSEKTVVSLPSPKRLGGMELDEIKKEMEEIAKKLSELGRNDFMCVVSEGDEEKRNPRKFAFRFLAESLKDTKGFNIETEPFKREFGAQGFNFKLYKLNLNINDPLCEYYVFYGKKEEGGQEKEIWGVGFFQMGINFQERFKEIHFNSIEIDKDKINNLSR